MRILYLAAKAAPLAQVGGLGEVAGALPRALAAQGHDIRVALPFSGVIDRARYRPKLLAPVAVPHIGGEQVARISEVNLTGVPHYLVAGPPIPRARRVYGASIAEDGPKFIFFCLAALGLCRALDWQPDVVHANDAHAGPAVYWLGAAGRHDEFFKHTASVFTVHNLVYMLNGAAPHLLAYGMPPSDSPDLPEWARDSLMGLGLAHADALNTVSTSHAQELLKPEFGHGFEGLLRARRDRLTGILNGLDLTTWNPARDHVLRARYDATSLDRRTRNKRGLQMELGLALDARVPLIAMVTRLDTQKGLDIALEAMRELLAGGEAQFAILGTGSPGLEQQVRRLARKYPARAAAVLRFDAALAHRFFGAADLFLMPSRYEPCGLGQMIALRHGAPPVVRRTGGLADTVIDAAVTRRGNGFVFTDYNAAPLLETVRRALRLYRQPRRWLSLQRRGMRRAQEFGWDRAAREYAALYEQALAYRRAS